MGWNYRIVRSEKPERYYEIRECYYDEKGTPKAITVNGCHPGGSTLLELRRDLALMLAAFDRSPLRDGDFPSAEPMTDDALGQRSNNPI